MMKLLGRLDGSIRVSLCLSVTFLATTLLLTACSGGGSGSSDSLPDSPSPSSSPGSLPADSNTQSSGTPATPAPDPVQTVSNPGTTSTSTTKSPFSVLGSSNQNPNLPITQQIRLSSARFDPVVLLQWSTLSSIDVDSILRYEYRMDGGPWLSANGTETRYLVDNLEDGKTHHFEVQAVIDGGDAVISNKHAVPGHPPSTNDPQPDAPLNFQAQGAKGSVLLNWERPVPKVIQEIPEAREHIQFYIFRIGSGSWQVTDTRSTHLVTGLQDNQAYTFTLKAVSNHGIGDATSTSATTTAVTTAPHAPTHLTATRYGQYTDLLWNVPLWDGGAEITSYQYRLNGGGWQALDSHSSTTYNCPYQCRDAATLEGLSSGDLVQVRAVNSIGSGAVSDAATVSSLPRLSIADASAREGVYETIDFVVTLDPLASSTVSVDVTTANGTARSGSDYTALTTTLEFAAGQTTKTVSVTLLDDEINESQETFTLELSNARGALIVDGEATGTIVNADTMPGAWVTRFGRTVGFQAMDAIEDRIYGARGTRMMVGGKALEASQAVPEPWSAQVELGQFDAHRSASREGWVMRDLGARELLGTSELQLSEGDDADGSFWTAWGRFSWDEFEAEDQGLDLESEVSTGLVGVDVSRGGWLAGMAVGVSEGNGEYEQSSGHDTGRVDARLTSVYPYARFRVSEQMDVWGLVGYGHGSLKLGRVEVLRTDLEMLMGALGVRSQLASDAFDLAVKSDAVWVRTESDAVDSEWGRLAATKGEVNRLRFMLSGAKRFELDSGSTVTPTLEIGVRHDGGDADTGTGLEAKAGMAYAAGRITMEGEIHGLVLHEASEYEEWGASGSLRMSADPSGHGLALAVSSHWGMAPGDTMHLWSDHRGQEKAGLDPAGSQEVLKAILSYGLGLDGNRGRLTPFIGHAISGEGERTSHVGGQWLFGVARLDLEGRHRQMGFGEAPENSVTLSAALHW